MTIVYDAGELGTVRALLRWRGTMLPMVLSKAPIYVLMALHIALHTAFNAALHTAFHSALHAALRV